MRIKRLLPLLLLPLAIEAHAQRMAFDSKYVKVGVMSNHINYFSSSSNTIRFLGGLADSYTIKGKSRSDFESMAKEMTAKGEGKDVLDRLLQRDNEGLHMDKLYEEALKNTTVEEVNEAELDMSAETKDVLKKEISRQLMKNNFIVYTQIEGKKVYWSVFKVNIDDRIIDQAFNTWRDASRYDMIEVPVTYVANGKVKNKSLAETTIEEKLVMDISKKVSEFAVRGPVYSRHPFLARMGGNQGVKRGALVNIYRSHQDKDGTFFSKKICSTRVSEVYNDSVRLYSISGKLASRKLSDIAVYRGRHPWSFSLMGQGSFGDDPRYGARMMWERRIGHFSKAGFVDYLLLSLDFNTFKKDPEGAWWDEDGNVAQPMLVSGAFNIGYGKGWNFLGRFELMPYIMIGCQYSTLTKDNLVGYDDEAKQWYYLSNQYVEGGEEYSGSFFITGHAGVRLNVNLWYPVQLTVGADYNYCYNTDDKFEITYKNHELNRVNFYAGLRFNL